MPSKVYIKAFKDNEEKELPYFKGYNDCIKEILGEEE